VAPAFTASSTSACSPEADRISTRTVEVHKARVMQKLKVDSIAQLVRLSLGVSHADRDAP